LLAIPFCHPGASILFCGAGVDVVWSQLLACGFALWEGQLIGSARPPLQDKPALWPATSKIGKMTHGLRVGYPR